MSYINKTIIVLLFSLPLFYRSDDHIRSSINMAKNLIVFYIHGLKYINSIKISKKEFKR